MIRSQKVTEYVKHLNAVRAIEAPFCAISHPINGMVVILTGTSAR
jgi:hypothetical protein